uniref:Uncharacterized protein n=1 Tax=Strongyloides papillosus TaxID=174720 RepID=A0A0N5B329_STREA
MDDKISSKDVRNLNKFFKDVLVVEIEFPMDRSSINCILNIYECMEPSNDKNYKYLFLLQIDDVLLQTDRRLVQIMMLYNGSVDIDFGNPFTSRPVNVRKIVSFKHKGLNIIFFNGIINCKMQYKIYSRSNYFRYEMSLKKKLIRI